MLYLASLSNMVTLKVAKREIQQSGALSNSNSINTLLTIIGGIICTKFLLSMY